ncbi:BTB/POZ/MATH-domain protein [Rhynchospora pubera]|uniref:BTB/POZ/MATH-domain protein n=1 Tax=Rhynchospora pubera TaxID=906938 RepID=A0AAV8C9Y8_9POAL|nr:BTB/POZ/MATH-domain protein [Rhynchospora pubera]
MLSSIVDTETASTSITEMCSGSHLFKVIGYSLNKGIGIGKYIRSDTFTVGGYDWTIGYYPDSRSVFSSSDNEYLSFVVSHRSEAAQVRGNITLTMLSQTGGTSIRCSTISIKCSTTNNTVYIDNFIKREQFEASECLKNDSFTIQCTVTVIIYKHPKTTNRKPAVQSSNLPQQLICLLEQGYGKDVSFNVSGLTFDAHRCVLAARSPVFMAQFFGPVKGNVNESIEIKDMEPSIFKSMLHFIYFDSVPELEEEKDNKDESIALAQHLLVAADRYGLERLKQLCELKMYEFTDANNVATTLTLAVQHNCSVLKAACIEFIKQPDVFADVLQSEGFEHMIKSCPMILEELRKKKNDGS